MRLGARGRTRGSHPRLAHASRQALSSGLRATRAGAAINEIGRAVEATVASYGYSVCRDLAGHGIGRRIHEEPEVPSFHHPRFHQPLTEGLVITIEPIIAAGSGQVVDAGDGWTLRTRDGSCAAHFEHTVVVTDAAPIILTG